MYLLAELYDISVSLLFALLAIAFAPAERSGGEDPWLCAPAANPARYLMGQLRSAWAGWRVLIIINYACWWLTGLALVLGLTAGPPTITRQCHPICRLPDKYLHHDQRPERTHAAPLAAAVAHRRRAAARRRPAGAAIRYAATFNPPL